MNKYARYAVGAGLLILAIIVIVVLFNIIRGALAGNDEQAVQNRGVNLLEAPSKNQAVQYTIRGAVVGHEDRRSIRITVDRNNRKVEVLQGYDDQVINSQQFSNTQESYEAFVKAINGAGFTARLNPQDRGDEAQSCPLGQKYNYEIAPGTNDSFYTWSTSCSRKHGTFNGDRRTIEEIFQRQIPNYREITRSVELG